MHFADMHCDTIRKIWFSQKKGKPLDLRDTKQASEELQIDLSKLKRAGSAVQNFAMFADLTLPADFAGEDRQGGILRNTVGNEEYYGAWRQFCEMTGVYHSEIAKNGDLIREARSYADIERNMADGLISAVLTIEEGGVLEGNLDRLQTVYDEGVRMMTLTWNYDNELGHPNKPKRESKDDFSQYFRFSPRTDDGLTDNGREAVSIMQELGIIADVSHLSDAGVYDVANIVKGPFVASHSNARTLCGCNRNMTDDLIRIVGEHGGVIGLNFCPVFVEEGAREQDCWCRMDMLARHARHMMNVGGTGVVGLGTDFDGIPPVNLEIRDASELGKFAEGLEIAGFTYNEIEAICYKNVLRVYREALK